MMNMNKLSLNRSIRTKSPLYKKLANILQIGVYLRKTKKYFVTKGECAKVTKNLLNSFLKSLNTQNF